MTIDAKHTRYDTSSGKQVTKSYLIFSFTYLKLTRLGPGKLNNFSGRI